MMVSRLGQSGSLRRVCLLHLRVVAAALALSACAPDAPHAEFPASWTPIFQNHLVATAFDTSRLVWHGDTADVWFRSQYSEPQRSPSDSTQTFTATDIHVLVHCPSQHARDVRMLVRAAGDSVNGYTFAAPSWVPFAEHTLNAFLADVCTGLRSIPRGP